MYLQELSPCHTFNVLEPGHDLATEKRLGIDTSEQMDHIHILFRVTESVKQSGCRRHSRPHPVIPAPSVIPAKAGIHAALDPRSRRG
jgi:hypothetical protein